MVSDLSNREKEVLLYIVESFIKSALPIGSRSISKGTDLNLSSATIRNVMSDLEEMDLLKTPHTSAGRIPTDKAYRYYVDTLMNDQRLTEKERKLIESQIFEQKHLLLENEDIYIETSRILGKISHQLAIITKPLLDNAVFERLDIVELSSTKILVVINIRSGYAKTVLIELQTEVKKEKLEAVARFLNERLQGLTLKDIRETFNERVEDYRHYEPELFKVLVNSKDEIYGSGETGTVYISGTGEVINQPEFEDPRSFKNIVTLAEDKELVVEIFRDSSERNDGIIISIGEENPGTKLQDYSIIRTTYNINDMKGNIGIIGPKRMNYAKMVSLLNYTSDLISRIKF
ncbi:MAG: heat-inducible transcription repressor HrcA [Ignavibacteriae bacterium]|nr:heat-inducible transcription repressor HrcA [Ignavibacteriota bacterium]